MINKKIILGTAQLNNIYGISNNKIKLNDKEFYKILKLMQIEKINKFDCAESYGNFYKLKNFLSQNFEITSKIVFNPTEKNDLISIKKKLTDIIGNKKNLNLKTLLIHNCKYIHSKRFKEFYNNLVFLKKLNFFKNIGFSCYKISEINQVINNFNLNVIQFPFNIFDQRLNNCSLINQLKKKKIKIQIRSIFLQGLLLNKDVRKKINKSLKKKIFEDYENFLIKNKISEIKACIGFIKQYNFYDSIVIGVDTYRQFKIFLEIFKKYSNIFDYSHLNCKQNNIILPYLWKKK